MFDKLFENASKALSYANNGLFTSGTELLGEVTPSYVHSASKYLAWGVGFVSSFAVPACIIAQAAQHVTPAKEMIMGSLSGLSASTFTSAITSPSKLLGAAVAACSMVAAVTLIYTNTEIAKKSAKAFGGAFASVKDSAEEAKKLKIPGTEKEVGKCTFLQFVTRNRTGTLNFASGTDLIKAAGNVLTVGLAMTAIGAALPALLGKGDIVSAAKFTGATLVTALVQKELFASAAVSSPAAASSSMRG